MVLEATVICLDNSDWMRNGDYIPSRLEAQQDAVNLICAAKIQSNPESTVSVMTMSQAKTGAKAEVLVTLTQDLGKILNSLHSLKIGGSIDLSAALQVAQLVLKHRQNKNQHQRVIAFVGSPVKESAEDLVKLGKKLKKNNIAVDIVNFGEEAENATKLEGFVKTVNSGDESHLINVPAGPHILSDILLSSPIVVGEGGGSGFGVGAAATAAVAAHTGGAAGAGAGGGGSFDFGVDPNQDPELAMVLRISMEEERARQEEAKRKAEAGGAAPATTDAAAGDAPARTAPAPVDVDMDNMDDELARALAMSVTETQSQQPQSAAQPAPSTASAMDLSEDDQLALALQMSQTPSAGPTASSSSSAASSAPSTTSSSTPSSSSEASVDQDYLNLVLSSLPGVDPNDERIRSILQSLPRGSPQPPAKKDDDNNDNDKK